jgi:hypothetical protein
MPRQKRFDVVFAEQDFTTSITAENDSLTVNDLLTQNGLMPRDGTFRYVSSPSGTMINHMSVASAPSIIKVQNPNNVVQLWVEQCSERLQRALVASEDQEYLLYGVERDIHANIFLTKWYSGGVKVGYSFSPLGQPYTTGKIVFLQVPVQGDRAALFNPLNGKEDYPLRLIGELNPMRGFWSAWQIGADVNTATYRGDLTPLPADYQPWKAKVKVQQKGNRIPSKKDPRGRRIKMKSLHAITVEPVIYSAQISKNNPSRNGGAIVCGIKGNAARTNIGYVAAWGNKTRPTMINRAGYQYGMSVFVKIPEEGRTVQVYNSIQDVYVDCRLTDSTTLRVEDLRGRWAIAQLRRHTKHKRVLKLHSMPSDIEVPEQ